MSEKLSPERAVRLYPECREWQGRRQPYGYGVRWVKGRGEMTVHRWVWEQINGPIPEGMVVMHTCDNPPCFLYKHLRLGTYAENSADMVAKGRGRSVPNVMLGERHPNHKLTDAEVEEMRMLSGQRTASELAQQFGITRGHVRRILRGGARRG